MKLAQVKSQLQTSSGIISLLENMLTDKLTDKEKSQVGFLLDMLQKTSSDEALESIRIRIEHSKNTNSTKNYAKQAKELWTHY